LAGPEACSPPDARIGRQAATAGRSGASFWYPDARALCPRVHVCGGGSNVPGRGDLRQTLAGASKGVYRVFHIDVMVFHMKKTTLMIPEPLMRRLKVEAGRRNTTISALVERALRLLLEEQTDAAEARPLPSYTCGRPAVDVANRDALYDRMDRE
jgi:hypothetical protein